MNALLVRVAADQSRAGGSWNGPVDTTSGEFAYVAIPENLAVHDGMEKPYHALEPVLARFDTRLPPDLYEHYMHLDPDFKSLTYGDRDQRGKQLRARLSSGDMIVFYAGLSDMNGGARLVYAIIGLFVVDALINAKDVLINERAINAHSRRILEPDANDVIVLARPGVSGRLERCLSIGEWRDRAYRVRHDLLVEWGGLSVKNGYLQRSVRLPRFSDPERFLIWLESQHPTLIQDNNGGGTHAEDLLL